MRALRIFLLKILNFVIPKNKRFFYASPIKNCLADHYDLLNYSGDTLLSFINYLIDNYKGKRITIYLEVSFPKRIGLYKQYVSKNLNLKFKFIKSDYLDGKKTIFDKIHCTFRLFRAKVLMYEPIASAKMYTLKKRQHALCLCYFSTFKTDCGEMPTNGIYKHWDLVCSTSEFDSSAKSISHFLTTGICQETGLPRNDYLLNDKRDEITESLRKKLSEQLGYNFDKIILYAPTFRDYESKIDDVSRNIVVGNDENQLEKLLEKENAIFVIKNHSWQNQNGLNGVSKRVILYEPSFDYTYYDLMKVSDVMITDYSSIGLDWLLLDRPLIIYAYDLDKYIETRGFDFEPFDSYCGGEIVKDINSLTNAIEDAFYKDGFKEKRHEVILKAHTHADDKACERVYSFMVNKGIIDGKN